MDAIRTFAELFTTVKFEDLPEAAVLAARQEVLDSLATAVGGSQAAGVPALVELTREWGGADQSTVVGSRLKCPAPNAARANARVFGPPRHK
jgi:2-methylcitrate dehydratase PrpD